MTRRPGLADLRYRTADGRPREDSVRNLSAWRRLPDHASGPYPSAGSRSKQAATEQGPFDVLVTDIVMPGSTGIDFARNLWETQPDLRVLFMSGYAEDLGGAERLPRSRFLAKPFTPSTLLRALDEVLAEAAEPQSD